MFGGVDKEEYERVVKANNELRVKMEKLRLENTLLKDQVRVLKTLQPDLARLYVFIQLKNSVNMGEIKKNPQFESKSEGEIAESLQGLMNLGLLETTQKDGKVYFSIKTRSVVPSPKGMESLKQR